MTFVLRFEPSDASAQQAQRGVKLVALLFGQGSACSIPGSDDALLVKDFVFNVVLKLKSF